MRPGKSGLDALNVTGAVSMKIAWQSSSVRTASPLSGSVGGQNVDGRVV